MSAVTFPLCVVPAAGPGTRMGELCRETPKCLLEVNGKPILQHIVEYWRPMVNSFVVVAPLGHERAVFRAIPLDPVWGATRATVVEAEPRGVCHAILQGLRAAWVPERFLVVLGDVLVRGSFDWSALSLWGHGIGVMAAGGEMGRNYAVQAEGGYVSAVAEKPFCGLGLYAFHWSVLPVLERNEHITNVVAELVRDAACGRGREVVALPLTGAYRNVGRPEDLEGWPAKRAVVEQGEMP